MTIEQDARWGFEQELEQLERMALHWQKQADASAASASRELIESIARGYALQLAALRKTELSEH